jgi:hypothetical protein
MQEEKMGLMELKWNLKIIKTIALEKIDFSKNNKYKSTIQSKNQSLKLYNNKFQKN